MSHLYSVSKDGKTKKIVSKLMAGNVPSLMAIADAVPTVSSISQFHSPTSFKVDVIISKKGKWFAGFPISPSAMDHPYTVRPYQHLAHDCSKP